LLRASFVSFGNVHLPVVLAILAFVVLFNFYQFAKFIDQLELHANSNSRLQYINATCVERIKPLH
jgi:hypothetical protein